MNKNKLGKVATKYAIKLQNEMYKRGLGDTYLKSKHKDYKMATYSLLDLGKMSKKSQTRYLKREIDIVTGKYDKQRDKLFRENYIKAMTNLGVSDEVIKTFKKRWGSMNKTQRKKALNRIPDIVLFYIEPDDDFISSMEEDIMNGIYERKRK